MAEITAIAEAGDSSNPEILSRGIENVQLSEVPCSSGQTFKSSCMMLPSPHLVRVPKLTCQERYDVYCKELKIADCRPSQVVSRVHSYLEENLMNKKWLAMWKGPYDGTAYKTVDIMVEVDDVCADQAHVTLVDPLICSEPSVPRDVIEAQLDELDYTLDIVELYPVTILDDDDSDDDDEDGESSEARVSRLGQKLKEEVHQKMIAEVVDNARFFFEHIRRDWDDEDEGEHAFDAYLRARLRLYYDVIGGLVPAPLIARYNRTMAKYFVRRRELLDYQARIQSEGEPTNTEAVECWRKYYEVLMLSGLLQIWETLQLRAEGPCFPRVLRRTKGPRDDRSTVTHMVAETLNLSMLRNYPDDTVIQQHKSPQSALKQAHEGDLILIFPGVYSGEGFHELTESVTIKGEGNRDEIVIEAVPYDDLFVNICGADVVLENLTFVQEDNTEGILRVESGHAHVTSCSFKCDGAGITVREGAKLTMKESTITGVKGAGVELMPGSISQLENNQIYSAGEDTESDDESGEQNAKGGIHLHVYDPPKVQLHGNHIYTAGGNGVTVGYKRSSRMMPLRATQLKTDGDVGDAPVKSLNEKVGLEDPLNQFLNIEMSNNVTEKQVS